MSENKNRKPRTLDDYLIKEEPVEVKEEVIEPEVIEEPVIAEEPKKIHAAGIVSGCVRLNVRKAPFANADVECVVPADTKLVINLETSVEDFYSVVIPSGVSGYCMKKYVEIRD